MFVPITYNLRSLWVRKSATLLTVFGIGATVAIISGVLALQQGFKTMFTAGGRDDVAVFLRPGATNEGDSQFSRERGLQLIKKLPEIAEGPEGPLAAMEAFTAVLLERTSGGLTNVPLRGVQATTFTIRANELKIVEGRNFTPGSDEVIVGKRLVGRIEHCQLGDVIEINTSPFRVVGVFEHEGSFGGEIWGDLDRLLAVLDRYGPNRVLAQLKPGVKLGAPDPMLAFQRQDPVEPEPGTLAARLLEDHEVPAKVMTERQYLNAQTAFLSFTLLGLVGALGLIMGLAAVFSATNTMLSAVAARTAEIGILLSMGFRRIPIFLSFLLESLLLGLLGGLAGCVMALPFNGIDTGTMNFQTFTELQFAFRVTPTVLTTAVVFALVLGLLGGALPAWRASRMAPTEALRRR
jgi:putative ABC transport system permease protein